MKITKILEIFYYRRAVKKLNERIVYFLKKWKYNRKTLCDLLQKIAQIRNILCVICILLFSPF